MKELAQQGLQNFYENTWDQVKEMAQAKDDLLLNQQALTARVLEPKSLVETAQEPPPVAVLEPEVFLEVAKKPEPYRMNKNCQRQIGQHLKIDARFWDMLTQVHPQLLAWNINELLRLNPETKRMLRTLGPTARAFLSDSYQPRDNMDLLEAILPIFLANQEEYQVLSSNVDENRLYLKIVSSEVKFDLSRMSHKFHTTDVLHACLTISNNEVGGGSTQIEPGFFNRYCENFAISVVAFRKYHVGRKWESSAEVESLLKDETKQKRDEAFFDQVRDVVEGSFDQMKFKELATKWAAAKDDEIPKGTKVEAVVESVGEDLKLTEKERADVLDNLIREAAHNGLNRYGVANAVTATAEEADDYDRATDLQRAGSKVIDMGLQQWAEKMKAAA